VTPETRDELLAQLPAAVMFRNPLTVSIAKRTFQLGTQQFYCAGVTPQLNNDGTPLVDDEGIHVVPLDNYEAVITLLDDSRQIEP
jgi:hypothetical protein